MIELENVLLFRELWINQKQDFCILSPMSKTLQTFIYTTNSFLI